MLLLREFFRVYDPCVTKIILASNIFGSIDLAINLWSLWCLYKYYNLNWNKNKK